MTLIQIGGEDIAVSTTAIGPTATQVTAEVVMAQFNLRAGGDLHAQTSATPIAAGGSGDYLFTQGNHWRVWGHDEVLNYLMVRVGSTNATVGVQYFGTGRT